MCLTWRAEQASHLLSFWLRDAKAFLYIFKIKNECKTRKKTESMPVILTPCGWILNWTTDDLVVYKRNNKDVKFYGKSDREILNLFKTNPERMIYDIEEDGEVMELLLHTSESPPKFYRLYQKFAPPPAF
jgi:hypothetical protein